MFNVKFTSSGITKGRTGAVSCSVLNFLFRDRQFFSKLTLFLATFSFVLKRAILLFFLISSSDSLKRKDQLLQSHFFTRHQMQSRNARKSLTIHPTAPICSPIQHVCPESSLPPICCSFSALSSRQPPWLKSSDTKRRTIEYYSPVHK